MSCTWYRAQSGLILLINSSTPLRQVDGGYAFVGLTDNTLIGARDRLGIRPLIIGKKDGTYFLASETCALDIIDAEVFREVEPGEVVIISESGIEFVRAFPRSSLPPLHI